MIMENQPKIILLPPIWNTGAQHETWFPYLVTHFTLVCSIFVVCRWWFDWMWNNQWGITLRCGGTVQASRSVTTVTAGTARTLMPHGIVDIIVHSILSDVSCKNKNKTKFNFS